MELRIIHTEKAEGIIAGAFIPGADAASWLMEIADWQVPVTLLRCYVMPISMSDNNPGGLFVIFNHKTPTAHTVRFAYTCVTENVFIPVDAELAPACNMTELKRLAVWDVQVFHPVIGMVGFEKADEVKLSSLIKPISEKKANWNYAHPPLAGRPPLQYIGLEPMPPMPNLLDSLAGDIGSLALDQGILDEEVYSSHRSDWPAKEVFAALLIIGGIILAVVILMSGGISHGGLFTPIVLLLFYAMKNLGNSPSTPSPPRKGGISYNLQQQRERELNRLINLFDSNADEALQYAIPLNSPYLNRGTATPSARLGQRDTNFNLGKLGGGRPGDTWNGGNFTVTLQQRYQQAANTAIASGDFKRAAYIYAHLLGSFSLAANVLKQGKCYYEAGVLFRDHIKNQSEAAGCFGESGYFSEAVEIYVNLKQHEKAAELYRLMGQETEAVKYYRTVIDEKLAANDYLRAADISLKHLDDRKEALAQLMRGWHVGNEQAKCLTTYLQLFTEPGGEDRQLNDVVKSVYNTDVPLSKKTSFLIILGDLQKQYPEKLKDGVMPIVYDVINTQLQYGDTEALTLMPQFIAKDALLKTDTRRFINKNIKTQRELKKVNYINLHAGTTCICALSYHDQLIGLGIKDQELQLFRVNQQNKIEYQFLYREHPQAGPVTLLSEPAYTDQVFIVGASIPANIDIVLDTVQSTFDSGFRLRSLNWLNTNYIACYINQQNGLSALHNSPTGVYLAHYDFDGQLLSQFNCMLNDQVFTTAGIGLRPTTLFCRDGYYYFHMDNILMCFDHEGNGIYLEMENSIIALSANEPNNESEIAVLTTTGCQVVKLTNKKLEPVGTLFGKELEATHVKLLPGKKLAMATGRWVTIFDTTTETPVKRNIIQAEDEVIQLLTAPKRSQLGLISRRLAIYDLDNEQ
ncbi:MAG: hypothetical protein AAGC65_05630 [Mucilaginibacter sp.]|uniref:hypothetical protein n=1 Tax=Mucilaginibacter sp. TaxID=1882438 RepID=UPI0031B06D97